jgi:adenylate cyclase
MTTHSQSDLQFEIGHVLFIDIVGYSRLLIDEQRERIRELKGIVRGTEQFRRAEAEGKLLRLPTGDGGALVFRNTQEAPVLCALEISKALKNYPELRVRMGIHSGPVNEVADLNEQMNVAGAGINIAQRVMDCGDAGHILLSKHVAEDLEDYARWRPYLHELGECETKHGGVISIVNLYDDEVGNPQLPEKLKEAQHERAAKAAAGRPATRFSRKHLVIGAAALLTAVAAIGFWIYSRQAPETPSEKSIAVLPFVNMSSDRENEYFVDGLTEEIQNRIAQINELKVPGRTSCFAFKDKNADLRQVGVSLGVAHVLEGSVRKSGERLRITAQLVRTLDGYRLWSQSFDRKLDDVFAIQEEIARSIADALSVQLKVGGAGQAERPTQDMLAYDNYLEARTLITKRSPTNVRSAIPLLEAAVQRDPAFAKAWAALAQAYALAVDYLPIDTTESLQNAENSARKALALDASLAAAHSALADVLRDRYHWSEAEAEYRRALELSPGETEPHNQYAQLLLSVGHTDSALDQAKRACELDPLAWVPSAWRAFVHLCRGELAEGKDWTDRSTKIRGRVGGFQLQLTLFYALAIKDVDLARWAIAQAGQIEWGQPPDTKVLELTDEALAVLSDHSRSPPDLAKASGEVQNLRSASNLFLAAVAAFVGQKEAALQTLSANSPSQPFLPEPAYIWPPVFKPLRNEPRFLNLVRAMKLPEYWRVAGWGDFCRAKRGDDFECIGP